MVELKKILADIAKDEEMRDAFVHNEDIHTKTASEVFKMHPDKEREMKRLKFK